MNEIIHGYVVSVILTKFRINANIQLWQSFSISNFEIGIVSDFLQYIRWKIEIFFFVEKGISVVASKNFQTQMQ